jgi:hypothetical protein
MTHNNDIDQNGRYTRAFRQLVFRVSPLWRAQFTGPTSMPPSLWSRYVALE